MYLMIHAETRESDVSLYLWPVEAMTISSPTFHVTSFIRVRVVEPLVAVWAKRVQGTGTGIPGETGWQQ